MQKQSLKYKSIIGQINYLSILLFVFWLPLKDDYLPLIMAIWIITWLLEGNFKQRFTKISYKYLFWGLFAYFSFNLLYLFRATDFDYGLFRIQEKLSVVFFPIILAGSNKKIKKNYVTILKVFVLGNFAASLFNVLYNLNENLYYHNGKYILRYYFYASHSNYSFWHTVQNRTNVFSGPFLSNFKHHAYFSMYILFSILILINFFRKKQIRKIIYKIMYILLIVFFATMLFFLQSRSGFVALLVVILFMAIIEISKKFKKRYIFIFIAVFSIAISLLLTSNRIQTNLKELKEIYNTGLATNIKKYDIRYRLWYTSTFVIKENFWIGTSPANLETGLSEQYKKLGFEDAEKFKLNAHNQYLETFAGMGVFGFLSLMFVIVYTFIISIRERNYLLFFLMLILSVNFLFESMLNRMAGVLFMMFFMSLLTFMRKGAEGKLEKG